MGRASWPRKFLILLLVLATPLFLYWYLYSTRRVEQQERQLYVTLAAVAGELRERLIAHDEIAKSAGRAIEEEKRKGKNTVIPYLVSQFGPCSGVIGLGSEPRLRLLTDARAGLELRVAKMCKTLAGKETKPAVTAPAHLVDTRSAVASGRQSAFSVSLRDLIPWDLVESEFEGLLVIDRHTGRLVAQDKRLPALPLGEKVHFRRAMILVDTEKLLALPNEELQELKAEAARTWWPKFGTQAYVSVRVAGTDYLAFVLPVMAPVGRIDGVTEVDGAEEKTTATDLQIVLYGLVQEQHMRRQAVALSPVALARVATAIAIVLLVIPFLKLRFIGRYERMEQTDVWLLGGSLLAAASLALLTLLHESALHQLRKQFDEGLEKLAGSVIEQVEREQKAVVAQLDAQTAQIADLNSSGGATGAILSSENKFSYPNFEALFFADLNGMQQKKWMPRTIPTPMISIASQSYFGKALALVGERTAPSAGATSPAFGAIVAPTSGLELGVFARPVDSKGIVAIATPLLSLHRPLVSEPFEFVVLDDDRRVIFRAASGPVRNDRFLSDDVVHGGSALVRAALLANVEGEAPGLGDYRYRARMHRMLARQLPSLDATLVAFYDKAAYESLAVQMFATSVLFTLGILASILVGAAVARAFFGREALEWAWPSASRGHFYPIGILASLVVAGVFIVTRRTLLFAYPWILLIAPGLAMIALGMPFFVKRIRAIADGQRWKDFWTKPRLRVDPHPSLYVGFAIVSIVTFVGVPAALVYDDAFGVYASAYESLTADKFDVAAYARTRAEARLVAKSASKERPAPRCESAGNGDRRCSTLDRIYASSQSYDTLIENQKMLGRYPVAVDADGSCPSTACPNSRAPHFIAGFAEFVARRGQRGASLAPSLEAIAIDKGAAKGKSFRWWPQSPGIWIGLVLLLVALYFVVRSVATHVLGLTLINDGVLSREQDFCPTDGRRWLLLRPPDSARTPLAAGASEMVDLRHPKTDAASFAPGDPGQGKTVVIDHLESALGDSAWRKALLRVIASPRTSDLVLVSQIDPFHYLAQRLREEHARLLRCAADTTTTDKATQDELAALRKRLADDEKELADWAIALHGVEKIRYPVLPSLKGAPGSTRKDEIARRLEHECSWSDPLVRIGVHLQARSDLDSCRWSEIVQFVLDAAEPYYRSLWDLCSREEKLVLIHLAENGLVNPKNVDLVRRLARRRLVKVDPSFRLMNESFREFVRTAEPRERVAEWESMHPSETWSRIGTPLYALAAMLIAILLITQETFVTNVIGIAAGSAGVLASIRNLYAGARTFTSSKIG